MAICWITDISKEEFIHYLILHELTSICLEGNSPMFANPTQLSKYPKSIFPNIKGIDKGTVSKNIKKAKIISDSDCSFNSKIKPNRRAFEGLLKINASIVEGILKKLVSKFNTVDEVSAFIMKKVPCFAQLNLTTEFVMNELFEAKKYLK